MRLRMQLDEIEQSDGALAAVLAAEKAAEARYGEAAGRLSARREAAGRKLAKAVAAELAPLRLEKARFRVAISARPIEEAGPAGLDEIAFELSLIHI